MSEEVLTYPAPRRPTGRLAARLGCLALGLVLFAAGSAVAAWIWTPPGPEPCTLPMLDVPRPGDVLAWSPDSRRLLVAAKTGEVSVVSFPSGEATPLPRFPQVIWGAGWDARGRPVLVYRTGWPGSQTTRLNAARHEWDRLPLEGIEPTFSPSGKWIAWLLEGSPDYRLEVRDLVSGGRQAELGLPPLNGYRLFWQSSEELRIEVYSGPSLKRTLLAWLPGASSLRAVPAGKRPARPPLSADYQPKAPQGEWIRKRLRQWKVPGIPQGDLGDWHIKVRDAQGRELARAPLGRRDNGRRGAWYNTWKASAFSPDGRYLAVRAPDDTLRLLELTGPTAPGAAGSGPGRPPGAPTSRGTGSPPVPR